MGAEPAEREFMGGQKSKMWTYLILMVVLIVVAIVINAVWKNPQAAEHGWHKFFGLPSWAIATVAFVVGALIYWVGLKIETDWPEAFGAFFIAGSVVAFEKIAGWKKFDLGGMVVLPYLIPLGVFVLLLMYAMKKSV
jgi:hypothetical protein